MNQHRWAHQLTGNWNKGRVSVRGSSKGCLTSFCCCCLPAQRASASLPPDALAYYSPHLNSSLKLMSMRTLLLPVASHSL